MSVEVDEFKMGGATFCKVDLYREGAQELIRRLVPAYLLEAAEDADLKVKFNDLLPVLHHSQLSKAPCAISFAMLCKYRQNACQFFYDMIGRWLLCQKRANIELFFS